MYVSEGSQGSPYSRLFRSDDVATGVPVFTQLTSDNPATPAWHSFNFCGGQCWYDNFVYTPPGHPDIVYLGGSFQYGENVANKRAVMLSTDAGETFSDMTYDATDVVHPNGMHPDEHRLVLVGEGPRRAVLDVEDVELDPLVPGQRRAPVDLRPACDARLHVEPLSLTRRVLLDLVGERWPRADQAHLPAHDVPELGQLVEREPPQHAPNASDARIAAVDRQPGSLLFCARDHRPQLHELELAAVLTHASLSIEHGAAIFELDRKCGDGHERACEGKSQRGAGNVECTVHRVPSIRSQRSGGPKRT